MISCDLVAISCDLVGDLGPAARRAQVFHGTTNLEHLRSSFRAEELEHVQFVSLEVDQP